MLIKDANNDGGVDAIFIDPNSIEEDHNLVLAQTKYFDNDVSLSTIKDSFTKMFIFYENMIKGNSYLYGVDLTNKFEILNAEMSEEGKVVFDLYLNSPRNGIKKASIDNILKDHFGKDASKYEINVYFNKEIMEEIQDYDCRRPFVAAGTLILDKPDNYLFYNDENAAIVNISAYSLKELYSQYKTNLLASNLRYYIKKKDVDSEINQTIIKEKENFRYKNNGITICCEDFIIDSKELKLTNFSIVNGGQTTFLISNSKITLDNDFYLTAKVIKTLGNSEEEKANFLLKIAIATNSQKAIKKADLKANTPEQTLFARTMMTLGIQYVTKRGEEVRPSFKEKDKNTTLEKVGKLCLAALFQLPGSSRNKPSMMFLDKYYNVIFDTSNVKNIAGLVKDYIYINNYYESKFIKEYRKERKDSPQLTLANNARTICCAFVALGARYIHGNIKDEDMNRLYSLTSKKDDQIYEIFSNIGDESYVISPNLSRNLDLVDSYLCKLFNQIISKMFDNFDTYKEDHPEMNETNYLKPDSNYYKVISRKWDLIKDLFNSTKELFL